MEAASWSCMYLCNYYNNYKHLLSIASFLVVGAVGEGELVCI